nr:retrovirus-related Pol polyprotein from transposon TNT 1-94 [Tanacetum cinerariifolium]
MLNKENYVPWSSRLLRYAKSKPNGKLIHNSILIGPYVRRMIPEPSDANREVTTILLGLFEDIYATVDNYETAQEIWLQVQQMMKGSDIGIQEKKANNLKFLNNLQPEWSRHVTIVHQTKDLHTTNYTQLYDFLKYNQKENYLQQPMPNPEDITDPTTTMNIALTLMAKAFKLNYSTTTNNNQRISSNPRNRQIAQPGINMGQDRKMQMVRGNGGNRLRQYAGQNVGNPIGNGNQNQIMNGNLVAARAEGNAAGQNGNQIRCYNYRGKKEAGIQVQAEEYDLMAVVVDLDEIEEVNANCILMANLQQASTSGTQTNSAPVYDSDGSAKVHENCDDNEIFNMFTQEEQYNEILEPILESHQVPQNDNDVISEDTSVEQGGETVEQHLANFEETHTLYESLYQNLAIEVEKVNSVNPKFVGDFKSLANEADASLTKHKALELEIKRLLKAVVSQDIMIIMQKESVVDTSDLQIELERTEEHFENCIIKKETEYAKLWNDLFNQEGKIVDSSESESKSDCSNGDNACCFKHMTGNLKLLINFVWKFMGTFCFGNDHVAAILEAARTMLIFSHAPLFLWAEAIATACFTQNRSIIHRRFSKTPYELINGRKPNISFLNVFGALYYPKNDREDIGKLGAKGYIGFFIGYSVDSCAYRIYNRRTKKIIETMNVSFDELSAIAFEQRSSKPGLHRMTSGQISLGLELTYAPLTITTQQPSKGELDLLFEAMYDDYIG